MREWIEHQFNVEFLRFAEWDGECEQFAVLREGEYIVADSLALLVIELQSRAAPGRSLLLAA